MLLIQRVALPHLEQVATHSGPDRDPRGWSVTTLYYALLPSDQVPAVAGDKTESIEWCDPERPGRRWGLRFEFDLHICIYVCIVSS